MPNRHRIFDLKIEGFRAFKEFHVRDLADVNLIVGNNNIGKTSLLEALDLYFSKGSRSRLWELLIARDEFSQKRMQRRSLSREGRGLAYEALFYGRPPLENRPKFVISSNADSDNRLSVGFVWLQRIIEEDEAVRYRIMQSKDVEGSPETIPGLSIGLRNRHLLLPFENLDRLSGVRTRLERDPSAEPVYYLPSIGMASEQIGQIWDMIALTEDEDNVLSILRSLFPSIQKVVLIEGARSGQRIMMAKLDEFGEPIPFKSLGGGVNRLLGVFLALVKARDGVLLVDEIENGIHYSLQPKLWSIMFRESARLNVQLFATTHSWDCVEGFDVAASEISSSSAALFRLEQKRKTIAAVRFDSQEIRIARRERIEVR